MNEPRLAIPLNNSSSRRRLGRGFGILSLVLFAVLLGYALDRAVYYRRANAYWPTEASLEIRLIKTPRVEKLVSEGFSDVQTLPETPWSLTETLQWSQREFIIYTDTHNVIGLAVDGDIPYKALTSLEAWGWNSQKLNRGQTLIYKHSISGEVKRVSHQPLPFMLLPISEGTVSIDTGDDHVVSAPFRFKAANKLDVFVDAKAFTPDTKLAFPDSTELYGSFAMPSDWQSALLPKTIPATFPGFQKLRDVMSEQSLDVLLGNDSAGLSLVLAMPATRLSLEELGAIATEGVGVQSLSTTVWTNTEDGEETTEIRTPGNIEVNVTNNNDLLVAVAKTPDNKLFRLTQSSDQLIMSNREPFIGVKPAQKSQSCLSNPKGFLRPQAVLAYSPTMNHTGGLELLTKLMRVDEFAFTKNKVRICW